MGKRKSTRNLFNEIKDNGQQATDNIDSKVAVLLVNFGGPRDLTEVKSFLYNLFSDPAIINYPFAHLYRKPLAWLISNLRQFASQRMYKKVGSSTPLIPITYDQTELLQKLLNYNKLGIDVFVGFRYCEPFIPDILQEITDKGYEKVVILPLFPQYSYTTTGSVQLVVKDWLEKQSTVGSGQWTEKPQLYFIDKWYEDEDYIQSFVDLINESIKELDKRSTEIIFSAHSIPITNIKNGDPYEEHIKETASTIIKKLDWKRKWHIGYQSKLGPIKWLEPATDKVIEEIASKNKNANILVVPISFVSEHVETIYEIGMLYRDIAKKCGIKKFVRLPALNTNKYLIQALYNQVVETLESNEVDVKELLKV